MNEEGLAEVEIAIYLFFLTLSFTSFVKIDQHLKKVEQRDLYEFEREWNKFTPSNVQRVHQEEK